MRAIGETGDDAVLYVNVAGLTNVAVANGSGCLFTRASAGGLDAMVHTLSERGGLTTEHAREWIKHVGVARPVEEVEGDEAIVAATRAVLEDGVHQLADSVRNSLNFYRTQEASERVERGVVTGADRGDPRPRRAPRHRAAPPARARGRRGRRRPGARRRC